MELWTLHICTYQYIYILMKKYIKMKTEADCIIFNFIFKKHHRSRTDRTPDSRVDKFESELAVLCIKKKLLFPPQ